MSSFQINIGDHRSPVAGYIPFPSQYRTNLRWARRKAKSIAKNMASADIYFKGLSGRRSLTQLLVDNSIWINYHATIIHYGETEFALSAGNEIALSNKCCRMGRWTLLATLIHELAHTNGADGTTHDAELALIHCGLGKNSEFTTGVDDPRTPYEPGITG